MNATSHRRGVGCNARVMSLELTTLSVLQAMASRLNLMEHRDRQLSTLSSLSTLESVYGHSWFTVYSASRTLPSTVQLDGGSIFNLCYIYNILYSLQGDTARVELV